MMTYITKDDSQVDDHCFIHFLIGDINYVACHGVCELDHIQPIPWELFYSKMKHTQADWILPHSASKARQDFSEQKVQFVQELSNPVETKRDKTDPLIIERKSRDKTLLDIEQERQRKEAYRWR